MRYLFWSTLLLLMWMVLTANLEIANIFVGLIVSMSVSALYLKMFEHDKFEFINVYWFLVYILVLIKNLFISNVVISRRVLRKDMRLNPAIVAVKTNLKSPWKKLLLANSITLTPGTLTLDIKEDTIYIHVIECVDIELKQKITQDFEDIIAKM